MALTQRICIFLVLNMVSSFHTSAFWALVVLLLTCSSGLVSANDLVETWIPNKRAALVIGNANYSEEKASLVNPVNDATAIAATFNQMGYDRVDLKLDLTGQSFKQTLRDFESYLSSSVNTDVVFFYAGHGIQIGGENYLIPTDADIQSETDIEDQGIPMSMVTAYFERDRPGANIIILDACRNNPFTEGKSRAWGNTGRGLTRIDINHDGQGPGSYISYATAPGRIADDGNEEHSVYTESLLKRIILPIPISQIFQLVRSDVIAKTSKRQQPEDLSRLTSNVYFQNVKFTQVNAGTTSIAEVEAQIRSQISAQYQAKKEKLEHRELTLKTRTKQLDQEEAAVKAREQEAKEKIKQANKKIRDSSFIPGIM